MKKVTFILLLILTLAGCTTPGEKLNSQFDSGRMTSINSLASTLETYFFDNDNFNIEVEKEGCLSDANGNVKDEKLARLFIGGKAPLDPSKSNINPPCTIPGVYGFKTLEAEGKAANSFMLVTNVETYSKANADWSKVKFIT